MSINKILPSTQPEKKINHQKEEMINILNNQEKYEHSKLTTKEIKQIIEKLQIMDLDKDWYSKWSEGLIFKIQIQNEDGTCKEYIAAKKRYDNNPDNERSIHKKIEEIVKETMRDSIVKVPQLKAAITLGTNEKFIIMEFVHGKTLYQMELEEIFKKRNIPTGEIENDKEAESIFFKILNLNPLNPEDAKKAQKIYYQEKAKITLFTLEQWKKYKEEIKRFFQEIHKQWVYHRDGSNPRNIMFTPDGKVYIIDFWKSIWITDGKINEKDIYEKQEGENTVGVYSRDEEILGDITWLTKNEEDMKREKEAEERKKKVHTIQTDKSMYEYLWEIPGKLAKTEEKKKKITEKIKTQIKISKKVGLSEIEEAKTKEDVIALLLAQSKENMNLVLKNIVDRRHILHEEIKKTEEKKKNIPTHALLWGNESVKRHNEFYEKLLNKIQEKLKKLESIENNILYIKSIMK